MLRSVATSRDSWTKAFTTRMPLTVSSTWVDRSATACWAAHVAANKVGRDIIVSHANRGNNTTAIRVSSGEIHNITPNVMTILST